MHHLHARFGKLRSDQLGIIIRHEPFARRSRWRAECLVLRTSGREQTDGFPTHLGHRCVDFGTSALGKWSSSPKRLKWGAKRKGRGLRSGGNRPHFSH